VKKLRIGLLLNSYKIPLWEYILIEKLINSNYATVELVIKNNQKKIKKTLFQKIKNHWKHAFYLIYIKLDKNLFKLKNNAFELKDIAPLLKGVEEFKVEPISTKFSDRFNDKDITRIKDEKLDILLRFGFGILRGEILKSSKYGIWSYHHGDNRVNRGGPSGFWEVIENIGITGSVLQILTEDLDAGKILYKSFSTSDEFSINRNKNNYYWKTLSFLPRKIEELYNDGEVEFFKKIDKENAYPSFYSKRLYSKDNFSNIKMFTLFFKHLSKMIYKKIYIRFVLEQWILLFSIRDGMSTSFWRFQKIIPPKDRFYADPFVVSKNNLYYIFIEELIYAKNKGHISVIEMDLDGNIKKIEPIIEQNYHLSYPHIIEEKDKYFMVPETGMNNTIELYECIEFPYKWEFRMNLMEKVKAVDSTFFFYNNKWWLFTNMSSCEGASLNDELHLFYADTLETTDWLPHPMNPIVSDASNSRPAGNIFVHNNKIFRPAQNSTHKYGYGMKINEILILDENNYHEVEIDKIDPDWDSNILRTHTFNHVNNLTVIDARLKRFK